MKGMFRSFGVRNYRVWSVGSVFSSVGMWMQTTALSWIVLTDLTTGDAAAMGLAFALQFTPPLVFVGITGWVIDRFDRRRLIMVTQSIYVLLAVVIGTLVVTDAITLTMTYVFAVVLGTINAFDNPARQAFITDLVTQRDAPNAVALNAAVFNTARLVGPALAGIVIVATGSGWVFFLNAIAYAVAVGALLLVRPHELTRRRSAGPARILDGFRHVGERPDLAILLTMAFILTAFGLNFPIFAATMALEFGRDADGFGILTSAIAIGSLVGALLVARQDRARLRTVISATGAFAVCLLVSSFAPTFWSYAAALVAVGLTVITTFATANAYVQTTTAPALRGRVLALYMAILLGSNAIGAPVVGWMVDAFGPRTAIVVSAVASLAACLTGAIWTLTSGRVHRTGPRRLGLTIDDTRPILIVGPVPDGIDAAPPAPLTRPGPGGESPEEDDETDEDGAGTARVR